MSIIKIERKAEKAKKEKKEQNDIHKLNLKIAYMANLTDLINEADSNEFDDTLKKGISHRVNSNKGNCYLITVTKI
jgi:hypothetical protein